MKNRVFSSLFITTLFLVLSHSPPTSAQQEVHEPVQLPYEQFSEMAAGSMKYYSIDLSQRPENFDVTLSVLSSRSTSPKLYVSKNETNQFPKAPEGSDYYSTSFSGNVVFAAAADLADVQKLYVGLDCPSSTKCDADITFEYAREFIIQADGTRIVETSYTLSGASSAVVRLFVPDAPKAERIVIHVDAIPNDDQVTPELNVFINPGEKIPFTNSGESIPTALWLEGRTIVIYKGTQLFCTNCSYTLSLKFNPYSSISLEAHVFEKDTEMPAGAILDVVQEDHDNSYYFYAHTANNVDYVFDIKPQGGNLVAYLDCGPAPASVNRYMWHYDINGPTEVILSGRERTNPNCFESLYYLLVTSSDPTVYTIRLSKQNQASKLTVGKYSPIVGYIHQESISYEILVPLFAAEGIIVELSADNAVGLGVINCRFPTDCPVLFPGRIELRHPISNDSAGSYNPPEFQYEIQNITGKRMIAINPHTTGCYPIIIQDDYSMEDSTVCAYKITLSSWTRLQHNYTLRALAQGHQWLFIGLAKLDTVEHNDTAYYMLNVPNSDASKVSIQLTKFSGDVNVYVSRINKYPNAENDETEFSHEGVVIFQNQANLSGIYFIGVYGIETSSYSISATVRTKNNKTEDYAQTLSEGVPQKGVLLPKHEHSTLFYKFKLDLPDDWEGSINVDINPLRGSLLVVVSNNGLIPTPNLHMWKSTGRGLQITSDDEYFINKDTYYIGVFVDGSIIQPDYEDITFTVVYFLREFSAWTHSSDGTGNPVSQQNFQHLFLSPLTPFHRTIQANDTDYYEAFILPQDTGITLYKQADAGDVDIFVSLDLDNQYPDENQYTYTTRTTHKDSLGLNQEDLTQICENAGMELCKFYIAVIPSKNTDVVAYSLSMKRDYPSAGGSVIPLEDGRERQLDVPTNSTPAYFYFYTSPDRPSDITVFCPSEEIRIYANRNFTIVGTGIKPNFTPPTEDLYEFTSFTTDTSNIGFAHLTIPTKSSMELSVITLSVYFKHSTNLSAAIGSDKTYTIIASSSMTNIYTGKPYYGAVEAGKYMYFHLGVFEPSCTLLICMTTLNDGDPDLIVSTSRESLPTIASHQFASISNQRTELLEINELDIYPKSSMQGNWVIGVYGRTNSTFTLTVLAEDQKMVELKANTPFEMYMREKSKMYFKHYHGKPDTMHIRIDQFSGDLIAHVTTVLAGETVGDLVSTTLSAFSESKWEIKPSLLNTLTIETDDENACSECLYLIMVEAVLSSKLSISINEGDRFIKIQNGMTYTDQLISSSKKYMFSSSNAEEVTLSINLKGDALRVFASQNPEVSEQKHIWYAELSYENLTKIMTFPKSEMEDHPEHQVTHNGIEYVKSEKDSFYIVFENPNPSRMINYTFTVTSKDASPILKSGSKHVLALGENEATSLIYYSAKEDQIIKLNIEFEVDVEADDQNFNKILKQEVPVSATFWSEKTTAGKGSDAPLNKTYLMIDRVKSLGNTETYVIREGFTLESVKGKYSFDLENPFNGPINIRATLYSSEFGMLQLDQNSQHSSVLTKDMTETYEVYLAKTGVWYLWGYSCLGDTGFSISENLDNMNTIFHKHTMKQGEDYLYAFYAETVSIQYARLETLTGNSSLFLISSKFFPSEGSHYNYDLNQRPEKVQINYQYQILNSQITVNVVSLSISNYDDNDDIVYHVKLCPVKMSDPYGPQNVCNIHEECRMFQVQYKINSQSAIQATFDRLQRGEYYVHVIANIMHKDQFIKFISYQAEMITIDKSITERVFSSSLLIVILALVGLFIVGLICYKCTRRRFGEEKGLEMPNIGKRRGYAYLGDDS